MLTQLHCTVYGVYRVSAKGSQQNDDLQSTGDLQYRVLFMNPLRVTNHVAVNAAGFQESAFTIIRFIL